MAPTRSETSPGAVLAERLTKDLTRLRGQIVEDPLRNPVRELSQRLSRDMEAGLLGLDDLAQLVDHLDLEAFAGRCRHTRDYLITDGIIPGTEAVPAAVKQLSFDLTSFDAFAAFWSRRHETLVFTGHPTFALARKTRERLADHAADNTEPTEGAGLPDPDITLSLEHEQAEAALRHAAAAVHDLNRAVLAEGRAKFPDDWKKLTPAPIGLATWIGYDMDGRTDIGWGSVIRHRVHEKAIRLDLYKDQLEALGPVVASITETVAAAAARAHAHVEAFSKDLTTAEGLITAANALTDDKDNLTSLKGVIAELDEITASTDDADVALETAAIAAGMRTFRLGMGDIHFRLNAAQVRHAARSILELSSGQDLFGRGPLDEMSRLIAGVKEVSVNFRSLAVEQGASARLFIAMKQIIKHIDADAPIRLLIAECENPLTVLAAIYQAKRFGVASHVDVCPLFETAVSLDRGRRILDVLLAQAPYRDQARKRGRICIETGFSDAGRFMGQVPAGLAIERLQGQLADAMTKHRLADLDAVIFDTHGDSMGRGAHPDSIVDRCLYALSPWARAKFRDRNIDLTHEQSYQGGDGYVWFTNDCLARRTLAGILRAIRIAEETPTAEDPFYQRTSASLDFYHAVKRRQEELFRDPSYNLALGTIGLPLLPQTGSRKSKRQFDRHADEETSLRRIRAIPHNGMLQQLGFLANIMGGLGQAIAVEPEAYYQLRQDSDRFDRIMRLVNRARQGSDMKIFLAYISIYSGSFWATRPLSGQEPELEDACAVLAETLADDSRYFAGTQLAARLRSDAIQLSRALAEMGFDAANLSGQTDESLDLLHAVRLALLQHSFLLAARLPAHSADGTLPRREVLERVLSLDFEGVARALDEAGPDPALLAVENLSEYATYPGPKAPEKMNGGDLRREFRRVGELNHRISIGIANHYAAIG
ncbi:phosphoenolpyruvate carboxylase [Parvularcula marina]|uniref:Phosphoenolpyruvate carboxylase n=1 Tax=Parvularcula marina TaxID=2292771 RepID=A0A371RHD4_9PROT|nr:phosphoenolpyruvate carboxylase [Parvularcula marina]RFB04860.1 phosphoenolpyruvate carboxylase [Parvularcula marina]